MVELKCPNCGNDVEIDIEINSVEVYDNGEIIIDDAYAGWCPECGYGFHVV
jgi:YgiT-type zinc finger domain-containing protein